MLSALVPEPARRRVRQFVDEVFLPLAVLLRPGAPAEMLSEAGEAVEPELRRAARAGDSAEAREAAGKILWALEAERLRPTGERLRAARAVQALEYMRTPGSRKLLERLVGGAPGAALTREARASLDRLAR